MAQFGSEENPFMIHTGTAVSKKSRYRKGFNKKKYDLNYERIFRKENKKIKEPDTERI